MRPVNTSTASRAKCTSRRSSRSSCLQGLTPELKFMSFKLKCHRWQISSILRVSTKAKRMQMAWIVGCDVGGTFTDFYVYKEASGEFFVHKTPSTPDNPARAIVEGLRELCRTRSID